MFGNTKKNNVRNLALRFRNDEYYDFMLYKGEVYSASDLSECLAADFNAEDATEKNWSSRIEAGNEITLNNIGFTGVDNGLIKFTKDRVSNQEFLDIFTKSTYTTKNSLTLHPISGNTMKFVYPYEVKDGYVALKGGYYQGFYKVFGKDYEVLPTKIENEWNLEFVLRKKDYEVDENILNSVEPDNKGIFFYMGLRSENKFSRYYNGNEEVFPEEGEKLSFMGDDISLSDVRIETENGFDIKNNGEYDIQTDNKHMFFNRTSTGFTTDSWNEEYDVHIREEKKPNVNLHLLMNRTSTGYTTDTISEYLDNVEFTKYDIYSDLKNNAFALKINDNGSIGYRYAVVDCENESGYGITEEYSKEGLVGTDEWVTVNVRISRLSEKNMKIYIYVNGNLILVSKELPIFNFRELNDVADKQEGVSYNISIGGGTQGLKEGVWLDFYEGYKFDSPLAKDFAGSFIGDIKSFKFYECFVDYTTIKNNVFKG